MAVSWSSIATSLFRKSYDIADEPRGSRRFCLVVADITERKRAEREIFELNAELEVRLERVAGRRAIDTAITGSLDLTLTLGIVVDQVLGRLDVDAAAVLLSSPQWDGTGYPRGLRGEQIPLAARIFAVVDIWDALCFDRPYRKGWPREQIRDDIRSIAGTHLDPAVVEVFLAALDDEMLGPQDPASPSRGDRR
ncbi:MAG: HD-GYP domain-containing protein [Isosphaeraceae bacterium]